MKLTKNTLAATFAALLIGGLSISPASAAVSGFDLTSATHSSGSNQSNPFGPVAGKQYSRADIASVTHKGAGSNDAKSGNNAGWSDISSVTHK
jgi:hypothetical protein